MLHSKWLVLGISHAGMFIWVKYQLSTSPVPDLCWHMQHIRVQLAGLINYTCNHVLYLFREKNHKRFNTCAWCTNIYLWKDSVALKWRSNAQSAMNLVSPTLTCVLMAAPGVCYGLFWPLLLLFRFIQELFNVILGHFHTRAAQSCSGNYMHWQLAQQETQIINWEAEMQVGNTVSSVHQMGGPNFKKDFLFSLNILRFCLFQFDAIWLKYFLHDCMLKFK